MAKSFIILRQRLYGIQKDIDEIIRTYHKKPLRTMIILDSITSKAENKKIINIAAERNKNSMKKLKTFILARQSQSLTTIEYLERKISKTCILNLNNSKDWMCDLYSFQY